MINHLSYKTYVVIGLTLLLLGAVFWWVLKPDEVVFEKPIEVEEVREETFRIIGQSVEGRVIEAYTFGSGEKDLLLVGGIHGGYEWNSVLLAYDMIDLFKEQPELIPDELTVTIVPSANPDGLYLVIKKEGRITWDDVGGADSTGLGRMNANDVDLNRNFACKWQPESTWRNVTVSAGTAAFSEPEAVAIRDLVLETKPEAVVFWHSQANAVYASECLNGVLPETLKIMNTYATAAGYKAVASFDAYPVTGDAEGWLASINIPAITVELSTHETTDWQKNLAGVKALLQYFSN